KNVDSHRHVQKTEPQLLFVSSQIHQGQTAKSTGPKPIERNSVNGYDFSPIVVLIGLRILTVMLERMGGGM
ncbi:MAG: hypothetical protein QGG09_08350, partial [Pirellulaceae bacterium]|nr:hypothetical protein [Pirellulaceae bacterium]